MLKPVNKNDLSQISLTGLRAIVLISMLMTAPRSLEEIRKTFIELNIMEESNSDDILRIDLNTIKSMGFEISRSSSKTDYKYVLLKHPFVMKISDEELYVLKRAYKKVKANADIVTLIKYDNLFRKIANFISDNEMKEKFIGISALKSFDTELLNELLADVKQERILEVLYRKPGAKVDSKKKIVAQDLVYNNDKIYLYGYNLDSEDSVVFNFQRIRAILSRSLKKEGVDKKVTKIKFHLRSFGLDSIEPGEEILESGKNGFIVEGSYHNEFLAIQRILSFGARCTVLEPLDFRNKIIAKLRDMRAVYDSKSSC